MIRAHGSIAGMRPAQANVPQPVVRAAVVIALTMMLAGCTPWPEYASGGLAERHYTGWGPVLHLRDRYHALTLSGADRFYPGRLVDVRNLINRATREHEGGLPDDAMLSVARAGELLSLVEADMRKQMSGGRPRQRD
ncbi:MAG: hypothetical protein ABL901_09310 [Hyphomicrobiaceae bacterium]